MIERVYRDVSSHTGMHDLLQRIEIAMQQLEGKPGVKDVRLVSISHDIVVQIDGSFLYTAIIACEISMRNAAEHASLEETPV